MTQRSLFDPEPTAPADPSFVVAGPRPDREAADAARAIAEATMADNALTLSALRRAAGDYFFLACAGKTYDRRPALKVTIPDPPRTADEPAARLVISPVFDTRYQGAGRTITICMGEINLTLCHLKPKDDKVEWHERLTACLRADRPTFFRRYYPRTVVADMTRACDIVARFVADPAAAVAASGPNCVICGRALTDPESRARGVGPECFDKWGDFIHHVTRAPEAPR